MTIKKCVGAVIYNDNGEIFLMTSPKWNSYVVPGGEVLENESNEEALRREIREERGIEIRDIVKVGEKAKNPSSDFKDNDIKFVFIDFFAKAISTKIKPNEEIFEYGWFSIKEALNLKLLDSTRNLINQFVDYK